MAGTGLGNAAQVGIFDLFIKRFSYSSNLVEYEGRAKPGTGAGSARWQIRKFIYTSSLVTEITWADGNFEFDNVWNDRATIKFK